MFSLKIVDTDAFLDMPVSAQALYFHLAMRADDDGFVANPKKIARMLGSQDDDYKVLCAKRFVVPFESGVCVIKHWLIHNLIRGDRYAESQWIKEKSALIIDPKTKKYSLNTGDNNVIPNGNQMAPQVRLGKVRKGKKILASQSDAELIVSVIDSFNEINPSYKLWYGNTTQRAAVDRLLVEHGKEHLDKVLALLPKTNSMQFFPTITTPVQLEDKWAALSAAMLRKKGELETKKKILI